MPWPPDEIRFWKKVRKTPSCWLWTGSLNSKGYGSFTINGRRSYAHRFAWLREGAEIPEGYFVCHRCDNRRCVRFEHLFLGTALDNSRDMVAKGRSARGARSGPRKRAGTFWVNAPRAETHPNAKLTSVAIRKLRKRRAQGEGVRSMARDLGISHSTLSRALRGETWKVLT